MLANRNSLQNTPAGSSNTVPTLASLAEPPNRQVDGAALDYLCIEMIKTLRVSSALATARLKAYEKKMIESGLLPPPPVPPPPPVAKPDAAQRDSAGSLSSKFGVGKVTVDPEDEELRLRLEAIGVHVGSNIAERYACC